MHGSNAILTYFFHANPHCTGSNNKATIQSIGQIYTNCEMLKKKITQKIECHQVLCILLFDNFAEIGGLATRGAPAENPANTSVAAGQ